MSRVFGNYQKLEEKHGMDSPLETPEGISPADTLISDSSRTVGEYTSIVLRN